jgi:hypothetical protein
MTVDQVTGHSAKMADVASGSNIAREAPFETHGNIDIKKFLGLLVVCAKYRDVDGREYQENQFYKFNGLNPQLSAEYNASYILPSERHELEKLTPCKQLI